MAQWLRGTVTNRIDWNGHLFSLRISCPEFPSFKAGQFTKVGVKQGDKVLSRPYSLVNPPGSDYLEILVVPVEDGNLSPQLHLLDSGDEVVVMSPATGFLVLDEVPQSDNLWMMATGTGVGPFLSILAEQQVWHSYPRVCLVYGMRYQSDFAHRAFIETCLHDHPTQFNFVPVISREVVADSAHGRIPALLSSGEISQFTDQPLTAEASQVMLCGNPDMITETLAVLESRGMQKHLRRSPGQISMERYW